LKYVALISCRNEEKNIEASASAVLRQSVPPAALLVVDDDSSDYTADVVSRIKGATLLRKRYPRHPVRGVNLALALNAGVRRLTELVPDWEYLLKVDADSVIPHMYVERLLAKFREGEPPLGVTSGNPQDERIWRDRASDGAKMFSRGCLDAIGGFPASNAFDTLMILKAWYHGWRVESYPEIVYLQTRTMRRVKLARWILSGRSRYYLGFPVWHTFLIAVFYLRQRPFFTGSTSMWLAHLLTRIGGAPRPHGEDFYRFMRGYALQELMRRIHARGIV
jgi:glycosyltransferase involved in cell wall biosynthesis